MNHFKPFFFCIFISHFFFLYSGYIIPKGWKVLTWFRDVHLDPEIYPDPKKFDPSRWEVCRDLQSCCSLDNYKILSICRKKLKHGLVHCTGIHTKGRNVPTFWFRKPSLSRKRSCQARDFHFSSSLPTQIPVTLSHSLHIAWLSSSKTLQMDADS